MRPAVLVSLFTAFAAPAAADTVTLVAAGDATLIEDPDGRLANGAGPDLFAGRTAQPEGSRRRALVRFDLSALPRDAVVEAVQLHLHVTQATPGQREVRVHRLLGAWGEGASFSTGGSGAPREPGDATWIHRVYDPLANHPRTPPAPPASPTSARERWQLPGGDFAPEPSARHLVGGPGRTTFEGAALAADVQDWIRAPGKNHGWLLLGDETAASTARRFASRQHLLASLVPVLEVTFRRR